MEEIEASNGIRFVWNTFPCNRQDSTILTVPLGFHYQPGKVIETMPLLEYDPIQCKNCKSILNPQCPINFKSKFWECPFCLNKNPFNSLYAANISETTLPTELQSGYNTVEYKLNKKEANYPIFIFLIDTGLDENELLALKENIQYVISGLPQDCLIGIITFGAVCQVHELGFTEYPVSYNFNGTVEYKSREIQEMLELITVNKISNNASGVVNNGNINRFIVPIKDAEFTINTLLDDLQPDPFGKLNGERFGNCGGLALQIAISILEMTNPGDCSRIQFFLGGPPTIGYGRIVGKSLQETIRGWDDFEKNSDNLKYHYNALKYYEDLAVRASKAGIIIDLFSCSFNQVGNLEMRSLVEKTGGVMFLCDSFINTQFKNTIYKIFELDENENLKICFKGKIEINTTKPVYLSGAIGNLVSLNQTGSNVSTMKQYEGGTKSWMLGGLDYNSCYTFLLDIENDTTVNYRKSIIQIVTSYIAGDRTHRLRITTLAKNITGDISMNNSLQELIRDFDQDSACAMLAKIAVVKSRTENYAEILKWIDKCLIRLLSNVASYKKGDLNSFKLPAEFDLFPQYMFYLRRSNYIQNFNASPDEIVYYKCVLLKESVSNCSIMIQPILLSYTAEVPEATPVFLDIDNMKCDNVLFLDTFFYIVIWHGEDVCGWRDQGFHLQEEYENVKTMIESPQEYAQTLIDERIPVPRFISCDAGSGAERYIKHIVDPSRSNVSSKVVSDGFKSDDVTLKKFMDYLKNIIVNKNS